MTSNTRVPKTEITGIYGALVKKMTRKMLGEIPEAAEVMKELGEDETHQAP